MFFLAVALRVIVWLRPLSADVCHHTPAAVNSGGMWTGSDLLLIGRYLLIDTGPNASIVTGTCVRSTLGRYSHPDWNGEYPLSTVTSTHRVWPLRWPALKWSQIRIYFRYRCKITQLRFCCYYFAIVEITETACNWGRINAVSLRFGCNEGF